MLIPEYFLTACSDHAERLAIITHNDVVTWAELATRVDGFRRWLRDHGVHRQDRVVLQTPSTVGTVALMWACLLDGVTMVPVHQDLTPPRCSKSSTTAVQLWCVAARTSSNSSTPPE